MKIKVWLSLVLISSMLCAACAQAAPAVAEESTIPLSQDTLEMVPDFSYAVPCQKPYVFVDRMGYRSKDKKTVYFMGDGLYSSFSVCEEETGEEVYSGQLHRIKDLEGEQLYMGDFSAVTGEGIYVITQPQVGDSHEFIIEDTVYEQKFLVLQNAAREYTYNSVSELAYLLANLMFVKTMYEEGNVDITFVERSVKMLLNSQDVKTGAFYSEIFAEPVVKEGELLQEMTENYGGTISLSATAQMAGILAQYSVLCHETDPELAYHCLNAAQKAYRYMEQYKANTDTDAWYYAAVQLYRATGQYKYKSAIAEYDAVDSVLYSSTYQGYTILADFTYLLTPRGTDYNRCNTILEKYMDKARDISVKSSRENFYVMENIDTMGEGEILENMIVLGIVNHVLSGQEYAGIQRNYVHYLCGTNEDAGDYMYEKIINNPENKGVDITNISELLVIFGTLCNN